MPVSTRAHHTWSSGLVELRTRNGRPIERLRAENTVRIGWAAPFSMSNDRRTQRMAAGTASNNRERYTINDGRRASQCAYRYPSRSAAWKKTRQVIQTVADPPRVGSNWRRSDRFHQKKQKRGQKHDTGKEKPQMSHVGSGFKDCNADHPGKSNGCKKRMLTHAMKAMAGVWEPPPLFRKNAIES